MSGNAAVGRRARYLALAVATFAGAGLMIATGPASAQPTEQVTVTGARMVKETIGRSASTGAPLEQVRLSRDVSYADLDLRKHEDVMMLHTRINQAAKDVCAELDGMFKLEQKDRTCVGQAVSRAMKGADMAVADAHK